MKKINLRLAVLALPFCILNSGWADVISRDSIHVTNEVSAWKSELIQKVNDLNRRGVLPSTGYTECAETIEIDNAYLCQGNTQRIMNLGLLRASMYVEGVDGVEKGQVLTREAAERSQMMRMVGGHDLRSVDLLEFHAKAEAKCQSDEAYCANDVEKELFESFILPLAKTQPDFVIITFAASSGMDWRDVVTHEIMHAQYFLQPAFLETVDEFWINNVSQEDKDIVKSILGRFQNANDDFLMKNEFQAYILMAGAEFSQLSSLVSKYRQPLIDALAVRGVTPVQVNEDKEVLNKNGPSQAPAQGESRRREKLIL